MTSMHLFFSHSLTEDQIEYAKKKHGVCKFLKLPNDLQEIWSNIPTELAIPSNIINKFIYYLNENTQKGDIVLVQGDFGMTYIIVSWCLKNARLPLYSTTERRVKEVILTDGTIELQHFFKHTNFRAYRSYE